MEAKVRLQKGPLKKDVAVTGRKVVVTFWCRQPTDAERAWRNLVDEDVKKRGWRKVAEKESKIIVPGRNVDVQYLPKPTPTRLKKIMGKPTGFR